MSIWDRLLGFLSRDLAMDLGTANTLIYVKKEGVVVDQPSVVVVNEETGRPEAVGTKAKEMYGKTPEGLKAIRPMKDGVIADPDVTDMMITHLLKEACDTKKMLIHPRLIVCIPSGITAVEKRAVIDSARQAGARKVYLIEEPMAAAVGAGLDVDSGRACMVIDIGGGTTEAAVISLSATAFKKSLRIAGDEMDEAIVRFLRLEKKLAIGPYQAERIKISIGSAAPFGEELTTATSGKNVVSGGIEQVVLKDVEIREALQDPVNAITRLVDEALSGVKPEMAQDIYESGLMITGGGSLLRELDKRIEQETNLKVNRADAPLKSVVMGAGKVLEDFDLLKKICVGEG